MIKYKSGNIYADKKTTCDSFKFRRIIKNEGKNIWIREFFYHKGEGYVEERKILKSTMCKWIDRNEAVEISEVEKDKLLTDNLRILLKRNNY